jgi:hypothetical protein
VSSANWRVTIFGQYLAMQGRYAQHLCRLNVLSKTRQSALPAVMKAAPVGRLAMFCTNKSSSVVTPGDNRACWPAYVLPPDQGLRAQAQASAATLCPVACVDNWKEVLEWRLAHIPIAVNRAS